MRAAIDCLRREIKALTAILSDNKAEIAAVKNGRRAEMFHDTAAIHQEIEDIHEALKFLTEMQTISRE